MKHWDKYIPEGTRDFVYSDLKAKRQIENNLSAFYESRGYREICSPTLEFYDVYDIKSASLPQEGMFKLVDQKGRLMVLRADSTVPVARIVATKLRQPVFPLRFFYTQQVYSYGRTNAGRQSETTQSGVELIGAEGIRADMEILLCAAKALQSCGVKDYKLEIGHGGFFKSLIGNLTVSAEESERIRECVELKNFAALNDIIDEILQSSSISDVQVEVCKAIKRLPQLFGGREVLAEAAGITDNFQALAALSYLEKLYYKLDELGLSDFISFDLGLVHHLDYYTGIVFQGYTAGSGNTILSGGRYDTLLESFGTDHLPAVGFAIDVDRLTDLMIAGTTTNDCPADVIVHYSDGFECEAAAKVSELSSQGLSVEMSVFETLSQVKNYAASKGIKRIICISKSGEKTE